MDNYTSISMTAADGLKHNSPNFSNSPALGNVNISHLGSLGYYSILLAIEAAGLAVVVLTTLGLCCNRKVQSSLAVFLVSQLLACVAVILAIDIVTISAVVLTARKASTDGVGISKNWPPLSLCQFYIWLYGFGSVGRLWSMLGFSIVVLVTVRYGQKVFKPIYLVIGVVGVWIVTFLLNLHITLPYPVYAVHYIDGVGCFPHNSIISKAIRYPTIAIWVVLGGLVPLGVSITIPIITLCYIKRNTVSQDSHYNKRIARFALFLVVGNTVNLVGHTLPGLISLHLETIGLLLAYTVVSLSVLPTPVIIIAFMKPVRDRIKTIIQSLQLKSVEQSATMNGSVSGTVTAAPKPHAMSDVSDSTTDLPGKV